MKLTCPQCQTANEQTAKFCVDCGTALPVLGIREPASPARPQRFADAKSPGVSAVLSFLIPGTGQLYNGDARKGMILLAAAVLLGPVTGMLLWVAFGLWAAYDAYQVAERKKPLWT